MEFASEYGMISVIFYGKHGLIKTTNMKQDSKKLNFGSIKIKYST